MTNDSHDQNSGTGAPRETPPVPPLPPSPPPAVPAPRTPASVPSSRAKAPAAAVVLSIILPGLGHLYAEAYQRGAMVFASFVLLIFAAASSTIPVTLTVLSCIFLWFYGMFDSYREAQLLNLSEDQTPPARHASGEGQLLFGVFLAVLGALLLVKNLNLFDLSWLRDWWPVLVVAVGVYLVVAAARERTQRRTTETPEDDGSRRF